MLINQKNYSALYVIDNNKKILCIVDDEQIVCRKGIEIKLANDYTNKERCIKDINGEPHLSI